MEITQEQIKQYVKEVLDERERFNEMNLSRIPVHSHTGKDTNPVAGEDLALIDSTVNDSSTEKHGFLSKLSGTITEFLNGGGNFSVPPVTTDATLTTTDITTNNVTSTKHGFAPKSPGDTIKFLNGGATPAWSVPTQAVSLKSYSTSSLTQSITVSGLDLGADAQYMVIIRYQNGNTTVSGTSEMRMKINADTGANYSYGFQSYSNSLGGARSDVAVDSTTVIKMNADINNDADGHISLWISTGGGFNAILKWVGFEYRSGIQTFDGGAYYVGAANLTNFEVGPLNATGNTKTWFVSVYTLG